MRKPIFAALVSLFVSATALANDDIAKLNSLPVLKSMFDKADTLYKQGHDNNWIEFRVTTAKDIEALTKSLDAASFVTRTTPDQSWIIEGLQFNIRDCVFHQEGAYGNHLTFSEQYKITNEYYQFFRKTLAQGSLKAVHYVGNFKGLLELGSAKCALGFEDAQGNVLLMQATTVD